MNLANDGAKYGADQYRFAHNYDLKNKIITIDVDGKSYSLAFAGRDRLAFDCGDGAESYDYECLKIEDDTYFVRFGLHAAVIELHYGHATLLLSDGLLFGSISVPMRADGGDAHKLTDDMVGTSVQWVLGSDKFVNQIYDSADSCRAAWSPFGDKFVEYPVKCVKIKDAIYLTVITGAIPDDALPPQGSYKMIALSDYEHMLFVGCIFGKAAPLMISGYGEFPDFS